MHDIRPRVLVSGWATDLCVDSTVRSAATLGYRVVVVSDCHTVSDRPHMGAEMREARSRVDGEGRSLYFYDYDNHLFELHTGTLEQRLGRYRDGP